MFIVLYGDTQVCIISPVLRPGFPNKPLRCALSHRVGGFVNPPKYLNTYFM